MATSIFGKIYDVPSSNDLADTEVYSPELCDEDSGHSFIQRRTIHVDSRTHRENKSGHPGIDVITLLQTFIGYW